MKLKAKKLLRIYLQDHDAVLLISMRVALRSGKSNEGTELGTLLTRLQEEFEADHRSFEEVLPLLGVSPSKSKRASTWGAEKLGRMKLNGRLIRYSPLSRAYESLALINLIGVKRSMWKALKDRYGDAELGSVDLDGLIGRAESQIAELEPHVMEALGAAMNSD